MDRPPESPDEPDQPGVPDEPSPEPGSIPPPASPYGPPPVGADATGADSAAPRPSPYGPPPADPPPADMPPADMPPGAAQPPPPAFHPAPPAPASEEKRPGIGAGLATGCGLQVLGFVVFLGMIGFATSIWGMLWGFILITVLAALLLISKRWRRFATGVLIVSAASWLIAIGPCVAMVGGFAV